MVLAVAGYVVGVVYVLEVSHLHHGVIDARRCLLGLCLAWLHCKAMQRRRCHCVIVRLRRPHFWLAIWRHCIPEGVATVEHSLVLKVLGKGPGLRPAIIAYAGLLQLDSLSGRPLNRL